MYEYVHDKELQPRVIERDKKSAQNNDKKSRLHSVSKSERPKITEPNIPASKIQHTHNNQIITKKENNQLKNSDKL